LRAEIYSAALTDHHGYPLSVGRNRRRVTVRVSQFLWIRAVNIHAPRGRGSAFGRNIDQPLPIGRTERGVVEGAACDLRKISPVTVNAPNIGGAPGTQRHENDVLTVAAHRRRLARPGVFDQSRLAAAVGIVLVQFVAIAVGLADNLTVWRPVQLKCLS